MYFSSILLCQTQYLMQNNNKKPVTFLVQHMEPYLFQWCLAEYLSMQNYIRNWPCRLVIANAKVIREYSGEHHEENKKYLAELETSFSEDPQKYILEDRSVEEMREDLGEKACMLDMRGKNELNSQEHWDYLIFGGVLGDHPPRDRPAPIRKHFTQIRHLGSLQLATDTAVLISRLIQANGLTLGSIPVVKEPTVRGLNSQGLKTVVQMEGFSYVSRQLDIQTGKINPNLTQKQRKQFYMSDKIRQLMIRDDLQFDKLM